MRDGRGEAGASAQVSPSYQEVEQHVFSGAQTLSLCLAEAQSGCPHVSVCSVALFVADRRVNRDLCRGSGRCRGFHLPYSPVRPGPHLRQVPVPLRHFP